MTRNTLLRVIQYPIFTGRPYACRSRALGDHDTRVTRDLLPSVGVNAHSFLERVLYHTRLSFLRSFLARPVAQHERVRSRYETLPFNGFCRYLIRMYLESIQSAKMTGDRRGKPKGWVSSPPCQTPPGMLTMFEGLLREGRVT